MEIKHKNGDETVSIIKVPLAYGPTQKFLARLQQQADLNKPIQMSLPRMSFEFLGVQYDPTRKSTQTQSFYITDPTFIFTSTKTPVLEVKVVIVSSHSCAQNNKIL